MRVTAFLGLGGNLGQPEAAIHQAVALLNAHPAVEVNVLSPFYRTEPIGMAFTEGEVIPWFVNAVAQIATELSAPQLLALCLSIEQQLGRNRTHSGTSAGSPGGALSRTLDVDILFYGDEVIRQPGLTVPHPRLHERAFTLFPLRDIAPTFRHPELRQTIEALAHNLPDASGVQPMASSAVATA